MRVVVNGGTGYTGRAVVAHLVARGDSVSVLKRGAAAEGIPGPGRSPGIRTS